MTLAGVGLEKDRFGRKDVGSFSVGHVKPLFLCEGGDFVLFRERELRSCSVYFVYLAEDSDEGCQRMSSRRLYGNFDRGVLLPYDAAVAIRRRPNARSEDVESELVLIVDLRRMYDRQNNV